MADQKKDKQDSKNAEISGFTYDQAMTWKNRYQTSLDFYNQSKHRERTDRIIKYLANEQEFSGQEKIFLNKYAISLKTLLPMVIARNPYVPVSAENDIVYEYGKDGQRIIDESGQPIKHDVNKIAETFQRILNQYLKKRFQFKKELRLFLRDAIAFNRGIFLIGHTVNSSYKGSFNEPMFHPYIISVRPYKIKRQAGTSRIDEGTYFFYEYDVPVSTIKDNEEYNQELVKQLKEEILADVSVRGKETYFDNDQSGYYDDVKYYKLRNGYDLLTGDILVFGEGCDYPIKKTISDYSFKNPSAEFIPNGLFQPERKEPISDLMMGENIIRQAHVIIEKAVKHVKEFNTGIDAETWAFPDEKALREISKASRKDRAIRFWSKGAVVSQAIRPRTDIPLGPEPLNMVEYLFSYFDKLLRVYSFQQGGSELVGADETATKTQAKLGASQLGSGDMGEMFSDAVNESLDKYLEVLIRTISKEEAVEIVGDAGETFWDDFSKESALKGKLYCSIDLQSMRNDPVKLQQSMTLYTLAAKDQSPEIQKKIDRAVLFEKIATELGHANTGVIKKGVDTKGMGDEEWKEFLKQQILKAKTENKQAESGAEILPPSPDDEDDIHLSEHIEAMEKARKESDGIMGQLQTNPSLQSQLTPLVQAIQSRLNSLKSHSEIHLERKKQREILETGKAKPLVPMGGQAPNPPRPPVSGRLSGQAVAMNGGPRQ